MIINKFHFYKLIIGAIVFAALIFMAACAPARNLPQPQEEAGSIVYKSSEEVIAEIPSTPGPVLTVEEKNKPEQAVVTSGKDELEGASAELEKTEIKQEQNISPAPSPIEQENREFSIPPIKKDEPEDFIRLRKIEVSDLPMLIEVAKKAGEPDPESIQNIISPEKALELALKSWPGTFAKYHKVGGKVIIYLKDIIIYRESIPQSIKTWVVRIYNLPSRYYAVGPPPQPGTSPSPNIIFLEKPNFYIFIDAISGKGLFAEEP